jgi:hypothetical protein
MEELALTIDCLLKKRKRNVGGTAPLLCEAIQSGQWSMATIERAVESELLTKIELGRGSRRFWLARESAIGRCTTDAEPQEHLHRGGRVEKRATLLWDVGAKSQVRPANQRVCSLSPCVVASIACAHRCTHPPITTTHHQSPRESRSMGRK